MIQDFEKHTKMILEEEQRVKKEMEQTCQTIATTKLPNPLTHSFEELNAIERTQNQAPLDMVTELKKIREIQENERKARIDAERSNKKFQWVNIILVALTLAVTILFGFHSCSSIPTSGTQESKFATVDSALRG